MPPFRLDVGGAPAGAGAREGDRSQGFSMRNLNAITPETETTTHYFWGQAHDFQPDNKELTERIFQQIQTGETATLALIVKADAQGSLEPIVSSLQKLTIADGPRVNVLYS